MKKHIIALLAISAVTLASCGGPKEMVVAEEVVQEKPVNEALEWRKKSEDAYIRLQTYEIARIRLENNAKRIQNPVVFIDVPFLMVDAESVTKYFDEQRQAGEPFGLDGLRGYARNRYNQEAVDFLRFCEKNGAEVYLMANERESAGVIEDLAKLDLVVQPSMIDAESQYGKFSENMTMVEFKDAGRIALVVSTSLGEASSLTGMGTAEGENMSELYSVLGDRLVLFPNPAFN